MSSIKRVLSINKDKKQPAPERDMEAIKRSISRPHHLAPKPVIDEWAKATKMARMEAEERERDAATAQPAGQPLTGDGPSHTKPSETALKQHLRVVFADHAKPLPPTPIASPIEEQGDIDKMVFHRGENHITVSLARKSAASSWFCAGPDADDPSDQAILQEQQRAMDGPITEAMPGGHVFVFRNEEERRQAIRVLATLRDSLYGGSDDSAIPKCGRDCTQCLQAMAHKRNGSDQTDEMLTTSDSPQVVVYVTDDSGDVQIDDEMAPRLSLTDIDGSIAEELDAQLTAWTESH